MNPEQLAQIMAMLKGLQQPQQPAMDIGALAGVLNAPKGHHYGIGGQEITQDNPMGNAGGDPFRNGFFVGAQTLQPHNVLAGSSPQAVRNMGYGNVTPPQAPQTQAPLPFGQGMINPQLPDAQKFQDSNFWSAVGQVPQTGWLPGATVRDETGKQYGTPKPKKAKSPFSFGTSRPPAFSF